MLGKLGSGWKGFTGGVLMIVAGVSELWQFYTEGQGDPQSGFAKIAAGVGIIGIRDAMGKTNGNG